MFLKRASRLSDMLFVIVCVREIVRFSAKEEIADLINSVSSIICVLLMLLLVDVG